MKYSASQSAGLMLATLGCGVIVILMAIIGEEDDYGMVIMQTPLSISQDLQEPTVKQSLIVHQPNIARLLKAVEFVESHGDIHAISKKGAKGLYQIMPDTARKPGMGVKPLQGWSSREQRRFAHDYLQALLHRYHGHAKIALAAYNCGIGCVEYGSIELPDETVHYVEKVQRQYALLDYSDID